MTWEDILGAEWRKQALELANRIYAHAATSSLPCYPPRELVFSAFQEVHPEDISVIILGQDPYHSPGKARGVAFGYHPDYAGPTNSSLLNIMRELGFPDSFDRSLRPWTAQGVLLLNTRLTVPHESPMGHAGMGWEPLMIEALQKVVKWCQPPVLAWGAEARKMALRSGAWTIIDTSHPCRYSASRGNKPFLGSGCFEKVNDALIHQGDEPINWTGEVLTTHE